MQDLILFLQQHWTLSLAAIALLAALLLVEFIRFKKGSQRLTPSQLVQMMNHQQALVVDLRPADQFAKGHIIDALSLPLAEFNDKSKKLEKMKARPVVLVCAKGLDSPKIAITLQQKGFHVHILGNGLSSWTQADLPLTKE